MNELGWIDFLRKKNKSNKNLLVGIGDDCALAQLGRERFLLKSDLFIEGVHFKRNNISLETVGERAVSRVLSDFAACGGSAKLIGISVGIPKNLKSTGLKKILGGVLRSAKKYKFSLVGGDTSRADKLFLDVWGLGVTDKFIARIIFLHTKINLIKIHFDHISFICQPKQFGVPFFTRPRPTCYFC